VGLLVADQETGVLTLGMQGVGSDYAPVLALQTTRRRERSTRCSTEKASLFCAVDDASGPVTIQLY
jgi:hypothetical protein